MACALTLASAVEAQSTYRIETCCTTCPGPWMPVIYNGTQVDVNAAGSELPTSTTAQREPAIGATFLNCDLNLAALWMDSSFTGFPGADVRDTLRTKFSSDGISWQYPMTPQSTCPSPATNPNVDGFFVSLFTPYYCTAEPTSGCSCTPTCVTSPPCVAACPGPVDCVSGECFPCKWKAAEPAVTGTSDGVLYLLGSASFQQMLLLTRYQPSTGIFGWPDGSRLRTICASGNPIPDRCLIAADPKPGPGAGEQRLFIFHRIANDLRLVYSPDGGVSFPVRTCGTSSYPIDVVHTETVSPYGVEAPSGAVGPDRALYLAWWKTDVSSIVVNCSTTDCSPCTSPDQVLVTRVTVNSSGGLCWPPSPAQIPGPGETFNGARNRGYDYGGLSNGGTSLAVDNTCGPFSGRIYVAYVEVVDPRRPSPPCISPSSIRSLPAATRIKVARLRPNVPLVQCSTSGVDGHVEQLRDQFGAIIPPVLVSPFNNCADEPQCMDCTTDPTCGGLITSAHPYRPSLQVMPWLGVDGWGNVGVAWYDTRYDVDFPTTDSDVRVKYDLLFSMSSDGGETWCKPLRITAPHPTLTLPPPNQHIGEPHSMTSTGISDVADYSQICADPRPGQSGFFAMCMENRRSTTPPYLPSDQSLYAYKIDMRLRGDYTGDERVKFTDLDGFVTCLSCGPTPPCADPNCPFMDMNGDGSVNFDDLDAFVAALTLPCYPIRPEDCTELPPDCNVCCPGECAPAGPEALMAATAEPCLTALRLAAVLGTQELSMIRDRLAAALPAIGARSDAAEIQAFMACVSELEGGI